MQKRATMIEVAEKAGVSQATVSLVLNGVANARVSNRTRLRVKEAAETLDYRKGKAHSVPEGRTRIIGLIIDDVSTTPFAGQFLEGARDEAALQDIAVATFITRSDPALEQAAIDLLAGQKTIGIIYASLTTRQIEVPNRFSKLPLILLNCYEKTHRFPSVVPGDLVAGYKATEALLRAGHRAIAHMAGEPILEASLNREEGYRQAMADWNAPVEDDFISQGGWTLREARERAQAILSQPNPPTAIFCYNDRMAIACYQAAQDLGVNIPRDLSIMGFDDEDLAAFLDPRLSTMVLPHEEMARWAVEQVLSEYNQTDQDLKDQLTKIECVLIERGSIGPPPSKR